MQLKKNKKLILELKNQMNELNLKNTKLNRLMQENRSLFAQTIHSLTGMLNNNESYYFQPHAKNVAAIAKAVAEEIEMSKESVSLIALSSLLINLVYHNMPKKYLLNEPNELSTDKDRSKYFEMFVQAITIITKIDSLQKHGIVLSQIWEHHDGTGAPKQISGSAFSKEAQIIAIANFYHNSVYRIKFEDLGTFESVGFLSQTKEITRQRHDETIKQLYRRANWFDYDLFNAFQNITKVRKISELVPSTETLSCITIDKLYEEGFSVEDLNPKPKQRHNSEENDAFPIAEKKKAQFIEKEIQVSRLLSGMVVGQNVVAKMEY